MKQSTWQVFNTLMQQLKYQFTLIFHKKGKHIISIYIKYFNKNKTEKTKKGKEYSDLLKACASPHEGQKGQRQNHSISLSLL